ncbi:MAG: hypothetical protein VYE22_34240 [Myxococcota bacterium]|nr:hypothetical protein [Myxococcota bacterium]
MSHLLPCDGCDRHVRADEPTCPFCGDSLRHRGAPQLPGARLGRAATFAFGAALAAATASGCGESHDRTDGGEPPADAAEPPADAGIERDSGTVAPPYGTPPDDGGFAPLYGGAPEE